MAHHRKSQRGGQGGVLHYTPFQKTAPTKSTLYPSREALLFVFQRNNWRKRVKPLLMGILGFSWFFE
jgi:hypothetical protein